MSWYRKASSRILVEVARFRARIAQAAFFGDPPRTCGQAAKRAQTSGLANRGACGATSDRLRSRSAVSSCSLPIRSGQQHAIRPDPVHPRLVLNSREARKLAWRLQRILLELAEMERTAPHDVDLLVGILISHLRSWRPMSLAPLGVLPTPDEVPSDPRSRR